MRLDLTNFLFILSVVLFLLVLLFPQYCFGLLLKVQRMLKRKEPEKIERTVNYVTAGIIFLEMALPDSQTLGISQELCKNATPGDLLEIEMLDGNPVRVRILEVRQHRDSSGDFD